ncbi:MAG: tyrosine-type recombinase/integrase, partial [Nitrosotalea sp.]
MDRSLVRFYAGIKSEATRITYTKYLSYFLKFVKIKDFDGLLQLKDKAIQEMLEDYVLHLKTKKLSAKSIGGRISALELFFAMSDRVINTKKIKKWLPAEEKPTGSEAWTREDIRKMLESTTSKRNRAIIHLLASTGCRIGAVPSLKLGNLSKMEGGCGAVLFYENTLEEYYGYLTPEAYTSLNEYLTEREKAKEVLTSESPLFRKSWKVWHEKAKPMNLRSLRNGLDIVIRKVRGVGDGKRGKIQMFHGIRKYFATIVKTDNKISYDVSERLLGHKVGTSESYFRPTKENLFIEFRKIMPDLLISEEMRLKEKAELAEKKISAMQTEQDRT